MEETKIENEKEKENHSAITYRVYPPHAIPTFLDRSLTRWGTWLRGCETDFHSFFLFLSGYDGTTLAARRSDSDGFGGLARSEK